MRLADIFGHETDYHTPVLRLRDVNRLKKMRAREKLNTRKHLDFVAFMYAPEEEDGEGAMFHNAPPPPLEPRFSLPVGPRLDKLDKWDKFDDDPMDYPDGIDAPDDDLTDLAKNEIGEIE
jgi:hypothetical protein